MPVFRQRFHLLDRPLVEVPEPLPALSERADDADHAANLPGQADFERRILPIPERADEIERVVERRVGQIEVELLPPRVRVVGGMQLLPS